MPYNFGSAGNPPPTSQHQAPPDWLPSFESDCTLVNAPDPDDICDVTVFYEASGRYLPATHLEPAEEPDVDLSVWTTEEPIREITKADVGADTWNHWAQAAKDDLRASLNDDYSGRPDRHDED